MAEGAGEEEGSEDSLSAEGEGEDVPAVEFAQKNDIQLVAADEAADQAGEDQAEGLGAEVKAVHKQEG
jgi:hypothetical protein